MSKTIPIKLPFAILLLALLSIVSCKNDTKPNDNNVVPAAPPAVVTTPKEPKIEKVTFYLENSASMFGYVNGATEYVDVLTELAQKPQFAKEKTPREFNFINGGENVKITPIGNDPTDLTYKLNKKGFSCGDVTKSNLNEMFQIALNKAKGDSISILISDGIYDVENNSKTALKTLGRTTRTKFIQRLNTGDIQTIMIKLNSDFKGYYYPISINGRVQIDQKRPYYIWIFGKSQLLNKYFPEEYISEKLNGYKSMIRFLKIGNSKIPYQATTYNKKGGFRFNSNDKNILENVESDRNTKEFKFSVAVDYSSLPFSDSYLNATTNYEINHNFKILSIENYDPDKKKIFGLKLEPTHIITVQTNNSPFGDLHISLKNTIPNWIDNTNMDNDSNITGNTSQTIGFKYLTKGITDAYEKFKTKEGLITTFTIKLNK